MFDSGDLGGSELFSRERGVPLGRSTCARRLFLFRFPFKGVRCPPSSEAERAAARPRSESVKQNARTTEKSIMHRAAIERSVVRRTATDYLSLCGPAVYANGRDVYAECAKTAQPPYMGSD